MMSLGPGGYGPPPKQRRVSIVVLSIATLIIVPWAIVDAVRGDESSPPVETQLSAAGANEADPTTTSSTTTTTVPEENGESYPQVTLASSWLPRGTSRYSETDDQTQARVRRQKLGQWAPPTTGAPGDGAEGGEPGDEGSGPTTTAAVSAPTTTAKGQSEPTPTKAPLTQAPPTKAPTTPPPATKPPTTRPPATQAHPTQPPSTQAPTTAAPPEAGALEDGD